MEKDSQGIEVHGSPTRCPYCHDACVPAEENVVCNDCLARHHAACWAEAGRCASCGIATPAHTNAPAQPLVRVQPRAPSVDPAVRAEIDRLEEIGGLEAELERLDATWRQQMNVLAHFSPRRRSWLLASALNCAIFAIAVLALDAIVALEKFLVSSGGPYAVLGSVVTFAALGLIGVKLRKKARARRPQLDQVVLQVRYRSYRANRDQLLAQLAALGVRGSDPPQLETPGEPVAPAPPS